MHRINKKNVVIAQYILLSLNRYSSHHRMKLQIMNPAPNLSVLTRNRMIHLHWTAILRYRNQVYRIQQVHDQIASTLHHLQQLLPPHKNRTSKKV